MNEAHIEDHSTPIQTPKQLIVVVVLAFLVPILLIVMITQMVTGGLKAEVSGQAMSEDAVAERLKPVGEVALAEASTTPGVRSGEQVVNTVCQTCHGAGLVGAPKIGDKAAWQPRLAQGVNALHEHAIKGIRAMPPRGGNPSLSDAEVSAAVDYMLRQSK
jgi:cytochrome c5